MATVSTEVMRHRHLNISKKFSSSSAHINMAKARPKLAPAAAVFSGKRVCEDYTTRFQQYATADFLLVIRDPEVRGKVLGYLSKFTIRSSNSEDPGRSLACIGVASSEEALKMVLEGGRSFGVIVMDAYFGPENPGGFETIRQLRKQKYPGCIAFLTPDTKMGEYAQKNIASVGADAILVHDTSFMKEQLRDMIQDLVIRNFTPQPQGQGLSKV